MEFKQVTAEEIVTITRGGMSAEKLLLMLDEAENEEHKFGVSGFDSEGKPITESDRGLVINYSLTTYFVSQADIKAYFETHDRPKRPMTLKEENVYLKAKLKELEEKQARKAVEKTPARTKTATTEEKEETVTPPQAVAIPVVPERDQTIPIPKEPPKEFTTEDLKETFAKEIHSDKGISEKAQKAALKKAEEKQEKRDRLT